MPLMPMEDSANAAESILKTVGDLSKVEVFGNNILVAVYKRPEKTASGLYLSDAVRDEDIFQGKVGLVLKKGPTAFKVNDTVDFGGVDVNVGDWIILRVSEAWPLVIGTRDGNCRMIADQDIRGRVASPDMVF